MTPCVIRWDNPVPMTCDVEHGSGLYHRRCHIDAAWIEFDETGTVRAFLCEADRMALAPRRATRWSRRTRRRS